MSTLAEEKVRARERRSQDPCDAEFDRDHAAPVWALRDARGFMLADGEQLPFASESFDVVYSKGVLHHTPDTAGAIREVHRVLRPGGVANVMLDAGRTAILGAAGFAKSVRTFRTPRWLERCNHCD